MKKIYYKIELRMGEWYSEEIDDEEMDNVGLICNEEYNNRTSIGEKFYYSDGYVILEDSNLNGFLSNDLISGYITEKEISIEVLEDNIEISYSEFFNKFNFIELPGEYLLQCRDVQYRFGIIKFINKINSLQEQAIIEEEYKRVKEIHLIP